MSDDHQSLVRQDGNIAGENIVAGDLKLIKPPEIKTPLRKMAENYRREVEQDYTKQKFIEELQNYMKRVPGHEQRDLEQKLSAAKRDDLISNATLLKEMFAKKLYRHTFSPMAQRIFADTLAMINSSFQLKIKPMIRENESSKLVDNAIYNEIVKAIYYEVGNSELEINMDHIRGMLYYLTGNCYIEW